MKQKIIGASGNIKISQDDRDNIVIDIDPTYGGQISINTVGTIVQGNWRAAPIESAHGGTGVKNENATLNLNGDITIDGPIVIKAGKLGNVDVFVPKSGTMAYAEDVIRKDNALDDIPHTIRKKALNNISPCKNRGDLLSYDGEKHISIQSLDMRNENTDKFLNLNSMTNLPTWSDLPSSYSVVENSEGVAPSRFAIWLENELTLQDNPEWGCTMVGVSDKLKQLSNYKSKGVVTYDGNNFESYVIYGKNHIRCIEVNVDQTGEGATTKGLIVELDPSYPGQKTINTVGNITKGEWTAERIQPEFGGTGMSNKYIISLGGNIVTEMPFKLLNSNKNPDINDKVTMVAKGPTAVVLPTHGTITTQEESLQRHRNLKDVYNKKEAFRHIAPTYKRGDIIVHGHGDYHTHLPIGEDGEVLCVDYQSPFLLRWTNLNIDERITQLASNIIDKRFEEEKEAKTKEKSAQQACFGEEISMEEIMHAICIEFDTQVRSGRLRPSKALQNVLAKWDHYIKNKMR